MLSMSILSWPNIYPFVRSFLISVFSVCYCVSPVYSGIAGKFAYLLLVYMFGRKINTA